MLTFLKLHAAKFNTAMLLFITTTLSFRYLLFAAPLDLSCMLNCSRQAPPILGVFCTYSSIGIEIELNIVGNVLVE